MTFITAFSENHAAEGRSLIGRLAKDHPDWKVYVYDIGMTKNSRTFFKVFSNVINVVQLLLLPNPSLLEFPLERLLYTKCF